MWPAPAIARRRRGRSSRSSRPSGSARDSRSSSSGCSRRRSSTPPAAAARIADARSVATERRAFREVARTTWRFFEDLVGPADHWLVPDNYQEDRQDVIAHRTSPTNIGLQLLSTLAAHDFGYLSFAGVLDRLEPTFDTLLRMQRYRGHFYNWYDTRTLAPLAAGLHLDGRQRQPRRLPADAALGARRSSPRRRRSSTPRPRRARGRVRPVRGRAGRG